MFDEISEEQCYFLMKYLKSRKITTLFLDEISKEQKRPNFKDGWWPHRFCSSRGEVGGPASEISDLLFLFRQIC